MPGTRPYPGDGVKPGDEAISWGRGHAGGRGVYELTPSPGEPAPCPVMNDEDRGRTCVWSQMDQQVAPSVV